MGLPWDRVLGYYASPKVAETIYEFARGRWVGLHCEAQDEAGRQRLVRYRPGDGAPLKLDSSRDVPSLLALFKDFGPRTFYATAMSYGRLERPEDTWLEQNWVACMPSWDIDAEEGAWRPVLRTASRILELLRGFGLERSVIVKWSGRGAHVHVHPGALPPDLRGLRALDAAYAITEYVLRLIPPEELRDVSVENRIDPHRLFTCPLSLHRRLDRVAVCIDPQRLEDFDISWTSPEGFVHYSRWNEFRPGEAEGLARRALQIIGGYPLRPGRARRRHPPLDEQIRRKQAELQGKKS